MQKMRTKLIATSTQAQKKMIARTVLLVLMVNDHLCVVFGNGPSISHTRTIAEDNALNSQLVSCKRRFLLENPSVTTRT